MVDIREQVARRLRELREATGLTQEEVADAAGNLSRAYLSELERGEKSVGIETLQRLAQALGVDVADLLGPREGRSRRRRNAPESRLAPEERLARLIAMLARGAKGDAIERFAGMARVYFAKKAKS